MPPIFRLGISLILSLLACQRPATRWEATFQPASTYASPRAADLDGDGRKEIILSGGGAAEWHESPYGLLALDARRGDTLWTLPCRNQMTGSPLVLATPEGPLVIAGGRTAQLLAVEGASGRLRWSYLPELPPGDPRQDTSLLNFTSAIALPDQDGDGWDDLLAGYGGYVQAPAYDPDRPVGWLMLISSREGQVLARVPLPDGGETYMPPVLYPAQPEPWVIFGSGGETLPGSLFVTPLSDLRDQRLDQVRVLATGTSKGFIAPPTLIDLDGDDTLDLVVQAYEGPLLAWRGPHWTPLWRWDPGPGHESHTQPAAGYTGPGGQPQLFATLNEGSWPNASHAWLWEIDGVTGQGRRLDSLGAWQMASPVLALDQAGSPVLLYAVHERLPTQQSLESGGPAYRYQARIFRWSLPAGTRTELDARPGLYPGSTLLLDDLDGDGQVELVACRTLNPFGIKRFDGIEVICRTLPDLRATGHPWPQYLGPEGLSRVRRD